MSRYDLVVYGASGFTGQYVVEYVHRAAKESNLSWAVAGRSEGRVRAVLDRAGKVVGSDLASTPIIVADSSDTSSLLAMAVQAKVVLNCVGPYRFYGEPVVEACVEAGAHHVDISGEPQFLEKMQLKYHDKAVENGVYVVGACGFDSIPADMGQVCVKQAMGGDVNSVESYLKVIVPDLPGAAINFGTWQSAIHGFAHAGELKSLRKAIYPERMPPTRPKLKPRGTLHYSNIVEAWCMPFMGSDKSVMTRTQRGFYHDKDQRPTQIQAYFQVSSLFSAFSIMLVGILFGILANFKWGRYILENFPGLCSFGAVSKDGVPKEKADNTNFEMILVGEGWRERVCLKGTNDTDATPHHCVPGDNHVGSCQSAQPGNCAECPGTPGSDCSRCDQVSSVKPDRYKIGLPFPPPCDGCEGVDWSGYSVRDVVKIPANLPAGKYILGFRYDCEATAQVWSNCADVVLE